jgi:hypothetical protein
VQLNKDIMEFPPPTKRRKEAIKETFNNDEDDITIEISPSVEE